MANDKQSFSDMAKYISHHIGDLSVDERRNILQMIINASVEDSKIKTKGDGTQIKYRDIPRGTILDIYGYINTRLLDRAKALQHFPDKQL